MKGAICYYSSTGNTKLVSTYISSKLKNIHMDLFNIIKDKDFNVENYDVIGFAFPVEYQGPPKLIKDFLDSLPKQNNKPTFLISTYGLFYGRTMELMKEWVKGKGFKVISGHNLHMPENFPPLLTTIITSRNSPSSRELNKLHSFIKELDELIGSNRLSTCEEAALKEDFINSLIKTKPRTKAREDMGDKFVDDSLCVNCGLCKKECPYGAIELSPKPIFDMKKCYGCWTCFNLCPKKAIYTKKLKGKGHYNPPKEALARKFSINI